jgi:hypothetical protein
MPLNVDTRSRRTGEARHPFHVLAPHARLDVGDELEERVARDEDVEQRLELVVVGEDAGRRSLLRVLVEPRGGEPAGAGDECVIEDRGHLVPFREGGGAVPGVFAHHEHA